MDIFEEIKVKGFADEYIDPSLDLFAEIDRLKKEKNADIEKMEIIFLTLFNFSSITL